MLDLIWILIFGLVSLLMVYIIFEMFRLGYNKEKRNERTDLWGRPNNQMNNTKRQWVV